MPKRWLSSLLWALGTFVVIALLISIPYGACRAPWQERLPALLEQARHHGCGPPLGCCGCDWEEGSPAQHDIMPVPTVGPAQTCPPPPPRAALVGYAQYPVQGAWSGMLPVGCMSTVSETPNKCLLNNNLKTVSAPWSRCIGLFANYQAGSSTPAVNETIFQAGYAVSVAGGRGGRGRASTHMTPRGDATPLRRAWPRCAGRPPPPSTWHRVPAHPMHGYSSCGLRPSPVAPRPAAV